MQVKATNWQYFGDVNMLDYGGTFTRFIGARKYQFIQLTNMDDACGRDNEGQPKYVVELSLVDLSAIPQSTIQSALDCCGLNGDPTDDAMIAQACNSYGAHAPLESFSGNNGYSLLKQARRVANVMLDQEQEQLALKHPVNAIGSTALEFMQGDINSAIQRGCESGEQSARILAKMSGCPQEAIK